MIRWLKLQYLRLCLVLIPEPEVFEDFPSKEESFRMSRKRIEAQIAAIRSAAQVETT